MEEANWHGVGFCFLVSGAWSAQVNAAERDKFRFQRWLGSRLLSLWEELIFRLYRPTRE